MLSIVAKRVGACGRNHGKRTSNFLMKISSSSLIANLPINRSFSTKNDDSHDDFKPKFHSAPSKDKDAVLKMIDEHVKTYPIMLYMKGTPSAPQCGFSMQVVRILHAQGVSFDSVNVLAHAEIRDGIKEYSNWPTIPQLYVKGEFIGGCDIVSDMHKSGELGELLAEYKKE